MEYGLIIMLFVVVIVVVGIVVVCYCLLLLALSLLFSLFVGTRYSILTRANYWQILLFSAVSDDSHRK